MADVIELLSELEDIIDKGFEIPFAKKTLVNKEQILALINDISIQLPDELRVAKSIAEDSKRIISDAQKQADAKVKEVEHRILGLIDEHEITKKAYEQANQIVSAAQKNSRELRMGARQYVDSLFADADAKLIKAQSIIRKARADVRQEASKPVAIPEKKEPVAE